MKNFIIGVSGKIGSGKTIFCKMLRREGVDCIEADKIVHFLYRRGNKGAKLVKRMFGGVFLTFIGDVNRVKLRDYFLEEHNRFKLFLKRFYPIVISEIKRRITASKSSFIALEFIDFDIKEFRKLIDFLVYIDCPEKLILRRYISRRFPSEYIKKVLSLQKKPLNIDFLLKNDSTKNNLRRRAEAFIKKLKYDIFQT